MQSCTAGVVNKIREPGRKVSIFFFKNPYIYGHLNPKKLLTMLIKDLHNCKEFVAGDNTMLREILHPGKADLKIHYSLAHAKVKPGKASLPHRLKTSEVYYILRGEGIMHIDNEKAEVGSNQTVYIPPDAVQYIENTGEVDLEFLCIVDPAWKPEDEEIL